MADGDKLGVQVVYAELDQQFIYSLQVPPGTTVQHAIEISGVLARFPGLDLIRKRVGIFGTLVRLEDVVSEGDRIEIYRPLVVDPKEIRRQRAKLGRKISSTD